MQALENAPEDVIYVLVGTHLDLAPRYNCVLF